MTWATQFSTIAGPVGDPLIWAHPQHSLSHRNNLVRYLLFKYFVNVTLADMLDGRVGQTQKLAYNTTVEWPNSEDIIMISVQFFS